MPIEERNGRPVQVLSIHTLARLAREKRAVIAPGTWLSKPRPAAIVLNMTGSVIIRLMDIGLYIYKKEPKKMKTITFHKGGLK